MIRSAAVLMREVGVEAMSFSQVVAHSGAPRGSIYHHFPGGKSQLVEEAVRYSNDYIADRTSAAVERDGPLAFFDWSEQFWADVLGGSNYGSGCPVVAATLEGERIPGARDAAGETFERWVSQFAGSLTQNGVPPERATALALTVIAAIEGAVILARAQRSMNPLRRVVEELRSVVSDALEAPAGRRHEGREARKS